MMTDDIYNYTSALTIPLCIMSITLNFFIIRFYWKSELTIVPLLYTLIASLDIICAIGVIYKCIAFSINPYDERINNFDRLINYNTTDAFDVHAMIFYFLIRVSYRCSVFCNLVLAVSRTIMILKPFYHINLKMVKLACILSAVPWIVLNGINMQVFRYDYVIEITRRGLLIGAGLAPKCVCTSFNIREHCICCTHTH